ncbi:MAG: DUF2182 domain-containing protein [Alphaproteobacteria bacterium]
MSGVQGGVAADPAPPSARMRRYEQIAIVSCLGLIIALAWLYLAYFEMPMAAPPDAGGVMEHAGMAMENMADMPGMAMPENAPQMTMAPLSFGLLAAMWVVMMIGMMLPSASPMIMIAARMNRGRADASGAAWLGPWAFALGYLLAWAGFSLVAAAATVGLQEGVLAGHEMAIRNGSIGGAVLIAAGVYQWTPLKSACLAKCRSPFGYFMSRWRPGRLGGVRMGFEHGLFCIGCCWMLMALMFVFGVMSLPWLGALAAFVLVEKLAPKGEWVARAGGAAMLGAGVYLIVAG